MKLNSRLPREAEKALRGILEIGEQVSYCQQSDLAPDRRFGESYLAATNKRLALLDGSRVLSQFLLSDLKEIEVDELFGSSRLLAVAKDGEAHALIYFSKVFVPEFGVFCRALNELIHGRAMELPAESEPVYCPKCGAPLPERGVSCPSCVQRLDVFIRLLGLMKPYKSKVSLLLVITFVGVAAQILPPYITKRIVDDVIKAGKYTELNFWIGAMIASGLAFLGSRYLAGTLNAWLASRLISDLRVHIHDVMQKLQLGFIHRRGNGVLISRIMSDTGELRSFLIEGVPYLMVNITSFVVITIILISMDLRLAILVFLPVPFLVGGASWFWDKLTPLFHKRGSIYASMYAMVSETLGGIRVVKSFGQENRRSAEFRSGNQKFFGTDLRINKTWVGFQEVMFWVMQLGVTAVWFFAARRLAHKDPSITLGDLLAFVGYIWLFYGPLQWFTVILNWMSHAFSAAERIFAVLDTPPEVYDAPDAVSIPRIQGRIKFDEVHFSYEKGKEVIRGMSFDIAPGEMVGLVGHSGAGKSTMIHLICRFYDADSGVISIDGHPIGKIKLEQMRHQIGMVLQDTFLFNASILDNIRYGSPDSSFEDVVRASKAAYAHDFIVEKEDGYDTFIGEGGAELSGGEKQRISIARAILHDPPILILDEATSSVDSETEKHIQEAIAYLVKGRTTIAIAHRLATLRNASRLFVVDHGRIVESGTHDELLLKDGKYARLVKIQTELNQTKSEAFAA